MYDERRLSITPLFYLCIRAYSVRSDSILRRKSQIMGRHQSDGGDGGDHPVRAAPRRIGHLLPLRTFPPRFPVQIFFLRSSSIRVDLLSYESKPADKREQYDWRAEKNLDG